MVALAVALAAVAIGQSVIVGYLVHALLGSQKDRDTATRLYRDELAVAETYLEERNEANANAGALQAERAQLLERIARLTITLRESNERLAKAVDARLVSGDAGAASVVVDELLQSPLPGAGEADAPGGDRTETAMPATAPASAGSPGRRPVD